MKKKAYVFITNILKDWYMKKTYLCFSLIFLLIFTGIFDESIMAQQEANAAKQQENTDADVLDENTLYAKAAVLMDGESGRILYGKEEDLVLPMASTTKIMTCILALEYGNFDVPVVASSYAAAMPKVKLGMTQGESFWLNDLLYSLMLESHNDSAVAIAEHVAGSTESFANMMNEKAADIGCKNTWFITPNGLDATQNVDGEIKIHSTTAEDLALIMRYCLFLSPKKDAFLEITGTASYSFGNKEETRTYSCTNHNTLLTMLDGAISGKTGYTGEAGYCYVGAVKRGDTTFIVALLACGWPNHKNYKWSDVKKLISYGETNYQYKEISLEQPKLSPIPVMNGIGEKAVNPVVEISPVWLLLKESDIITMDYKIVNQLEAPVANGESIGEVTYYLNGKEIATYGIYTDKAIGRVTWKWYFTEVFTHFLGRKT